MALSDLLEHTVGLYGQVNTQDSSGGTVTDWPTARATNIPCLIKGDGGDEIVLYAQRQIRVTHTIATLNAQAMSGDKVIDQDGATYLIISIRLQRGVGGIETWYLWRASELLPGGT